jgi:hypothetical protein
MSYRSGLSCLLGNWGHPEQLANQVTQFTEGFFIFPPRNKRSLTGVI